MEAVEDKLASCTISPSSRPQTVEHLIVVDFEATCDSGEECLTRLQQCDRHEIIEFPALWLDARDAVERGCFHEYVRPTETHHAQYHAPEAPPSLARQLSAFCTQLTGITQEQVNGAAPLADVLSRFVQWIEACGLAAALRNGTAVFIAHGGWDLGDQLPREVRRQ